MHNNNVYDYDTPLVIAITKYIVYVKNLNS